MRRTALRAPCCALLLAAGTVAIAHPREAHPGFTVSMGEPSTHYLHVVMRCPGTRGQDLDVKMPSWTPGYYRIMDHARSVVGVRAQDGEGRSLAWEKTTKNTWHVRSGDAGSVQVSYDVYAFARSVADSFLDDTQAFLSPTGLFLYPAGQLGQPATVTIEPAPGFARISAGLEPVAGKPGTFRASDFDELYDCPLLVGNQEVLFFDVRGVPHRVSIAEPGRFDRDELVRMLKRVVEAAVAVIDDVPYRHYDFLLLGEGMGGLEHRNSVAAFSKIPSLDDPKDYRGWLGFLAHEFFPSTTSRPSGRSPSARSTTTGRTTPPCSGSPRASPWANTTISYYDKGAALGLLLDLKIRHETKNRRSLDDVMRTLYDVYYRKKHRGFTHEELRQASESVAGASLAEIFDVYASTTADIDYARYLAYAGLEIQLAPTTLAGASLGATTREQDGKLIVAGVTRDSAAARAGLSVDDEILAWDGVRVSGKAVGDTLRAAAPGDKVRLLVARRDRARELEIVLDRNLEPSFKTQPLPHPDALQSETLDAWLPSVPEKGR